MILLWVSIVTVFFNLDLCQGRPPSCLKVATFNAALLKQIGNYEVRKPRIGTGLLQANSDVYCLQEVWLESDLERILEATREFYPHHYSSIHVATDHLRPPAMDLSSQMDNSYLQSSSCNSLDQVFFRFAVFGCISTEGCLPEYAKSSVEGLACMMRKCSPVLASKFISPNCIQCLVLFMTSITDSGAQCYDDPNNKRNRLNPLGLAILSKYPILNAHHARFHVNDSIVDRGYLQATIDGYGTFVCTHLTAISPVYIEYSLNYGNYIAQHNFEITSLLDTFQYEDHVIFGDLNTGLADPGRRVLAEYGENYQRFVDAGYRNPYLEMVGICTYCNGNPLSGEYKNVTIDHVIIKGNHLTAPDAKRIIDDVTCPYCPLSDHYGVETTLCRSP